MSLKVKVYKKIGVNTNNDYGVWIKSTKILRQLIGVLGMVLPILLVLFSDNCYSVPLESISHYYYTTAASFFTVILSLVGVFLIIYTKNFELSTIAGVAALCVVFFPTSLLSDNCCIVNYPKNEFRVGFHYFSAAVFLAILGYMSMCYFTKLDEEEKAINKTEVSYVWLYELCGALVFFSIAFIGFYAVANNYFKDWFRGFITFYDANKLTFWMEVLALESFGIAWLVRGTNTPTQQEIIRVK